MRRAFTDVHPAVQFGFFTAVMLFTMLIQQPVIVITSLLCSLIYGFYVGGRSSRRSFLRLILPSSFLVCIINPLFNHAGITILFYLPDGNPFTLESVIYGLVSGSMFSAVMLWCLCLRFTMTSDRIIFLFGRAAPKLGLLLSMIIRFIPQFTSQFRCVRSSQRCLGKDINQGNIFRRTSNFVRILSSVIGWSMEHSLITADSMKSRGYGLGRRTSYTIFRFERRDLFLLSFTLLLSALVIFGFINSLGEFCYFPAVSQIGVSFVDIFTYVAFALLCVFPGIMDLKEGKKWTAIP